MGSAAAMICAKRPKLILTAAKKAISVFRLEMISRAFRAGDNLLTEHVLWRTAIHTGRRKANTRKAARPGRWLRRGKAFL